MLDDIEAACKTFEILIICYIADKHSLALSSNLNSGCTVDLTSSQKFFYFSMVSLRHLAN